MKIWKKGSIMAAMDNNVDWSTLAARYAYKSSDLDRVRNGIANALVSLMGDMYQSGGGITVLTPEGDMEQYTGYATARDCVEALSPAAIGWAVSLYRQDLRIDITAQMNEMRIVLGGPQAQLANFRGALEHFSTVSGLMKVGQPMSMRGERRNYFFERTVTKESFHSLLAMLGEYESNSGRFQGQIRAKGPDTGYSDLDKWTKDVEEQWDELKGITYWRMDQRANQWAWIDFDAQGIALNLWATPELAGHAGLRFEDFVARLQLFTSDSDPSQWNRFSRTFRKKEKDKKWKEDDDQRVATAIEAAIKVVFDEGRMFVQYAGFVEGGQAEQQVLFSDVDGFLVHLRSDAEYQLATLTLKGPRGKGLEFVINPKQCETIVRGVVVVSNNMVAQRSMLIEKQITALTAPFRDKDTGLELTNSENSAPPSDAAAAKPAASASAWMTPWIPVVTAVVTAVVAFLLGSNGLQSVKPTLKITYPEDVSAGAAAPVLDHELLLRWTLTSKRLLTGERTQELPATVIVHQLNAPHRSQVYNEQRTGSSYPLAAPGEYAVTVRVDVDGSPSEQNFKAVVPAVAAAAPAH